MPSILLNGERRSGRMGKMLIEESPLLVSPTLAKIIGLNESIVLQQIHYWLQVKESTGKDFIDGHYWVYNSYRQWNEQFPFWSVETIKRVFHSLEEKELLISGNFNEKWYDKTKWYSIDYCRLREFLRLGQNDLIVGPNCTHRLGQNDPTNTIDYITDINNNNVTNPLEEKNPEDSDKDNAFSKKEKDTYASSDMYIDINVKNSIDKQRKLINERKKKSDTLSFNESVKLTERTIHAAMAKSDIGQDSYFESLVQSMVRYFLESYHKSRTEVHPALTMSQSVKIINKYVVPPKSLANEDVGLEEYKKMIDIYFKTKFGQRSGKIVDYRIMHFMSDRIRERMYWKISNSDI